MLYNQSLHVYYPENVYSHDDEPVNLPRVQFQGTIVENVETRLAWSLLEIIALRSASAN